MKILIVKLGALGDVINTFPLAVNLKEKLECEIHWLVAPLSYLLVVNHSCVDKAILFDRKHTIKSLRHVLQQIRMDAYDITFDLQRTLKSGFFALAANSRRRIGFDKKRCKEMSWLFPFERIKSSDPEKHMLDQYLEFSAHLDLRCDHIQWKIPRTETTISGIPKKYLVLNIGATKSANQWSPYHFANLIDAIDNELNIPCILTGGPQDRQPAKIIMSESACPVVDLTGKTSVPELVEVLANAVCTISCDTGPMHLAKALNTKVVALFGPSNPERTGPYHGVVIKKDVDCSPCNQKQCRDPFCMDAIKPSDVMAQLKHLLNHHS
ncbi:glycosyltransferase family 9 protein [Desulfobacula sp.]|uniref:glycosyltransferase family 9 protein n=1 Tax=Desulfobacula sp. TaxID=2593537 RepID=UPI0025BAE9E9|nr:glycosyltransferase family 9 protein [Desulfobacula sp.]MBC2703072.1 glycosyltransferase family 9 protein [Desulfobacula sp.]